MEIKKFITDNEKMTVEPSPGVTYDLRDVIDESHRLYNSKFQNPVDASGLTKIFYNIIWIIYRTIMMSSDIDLKDMNARSINGHAMKMLNILKMAVRSHLLRTGFGIYVDKVMSEMVWFGTSITKRVGDKLETVDLRNYITQANIKDPQKRSHAESLVYTYDELLEFKDAWKDNWDEIESLWEKMQSDGLSSFNIIEYWTWGKLSEEDEETHKICITYLDRGEENKEEYRGTTEWSPYLELERYKTPYKRRRTGKKEIAKLGEWEEVFPYEQVDFFDVPGRFLGFGAAELLSGICEHYNEKWNLYRKKDILDLRGIFIHKYTSDSNSLTQEFLDNLETGDVLSMDVNEDMQRLAVDVKTGEFINSIDKLYEVARLIMGVTASAAGEEMPSRQNIPEVIAQQSQQQTTYDYVRERMHHFLVGVFSNGYLDTIIDELDQNELTAIVGDPRQLKELDGWLIEEATNDEFNRIWKETGEMPDEEEYKAIKDKAALELEEQGDMRFPAIKKQMLKNIEYVIEFYVTNEGFDKNMEIKTLQFMAANDPALSKKALNMEILDLLNKNPKQFEKTEEEKLDELKMAMSQAMGGQTLTEAPPAVEDPMENSI